MALPPLAYPDDLAAWTGVSIAENDPRAEAVLSAAAGMVRSYTGLTWQTEEVPDDVKAVVVQVASRVWVNPAALESLTVDDATRRWGSSGGLGLRLTDADKDILSGYVSGGGTPGIGTLSISVNSNRDHTIYVPTAPEPSGQPFPWFDADDLP